MAMRYGLQCIKIDYSSTISIKAAEAAAQRPKLLEMLDTLLAQRGSMFCVISTRPAGIDHDWFGEHRFTELEMRHLALPMANPTPATPCRQ